MLTDETFGHRMQWNSIPMPRRVLPGHRPQDDSPERQQRERWAVLEQGDPVQDVLCGADDDHIPIEGSGCNAGTKTLM